MLIESYDPTSHQFGDRMAIELTDSSSRSTGMTWAPGAINPVPEPASLIALGAGTLAFVRRRKK